MDDALVTGRAARSRSAAHRREVSAHPFASVPQYEWGNPGVHLYCDLYCETLIYRENCDISLKFHYPGYFPESSVHCITDAGECAEAPALQDMYVGNCMPPVGLGEAAPACLSLHRNSVGRILTVAAALRRAPRDHPSARHRLKKPTLRSRNPMSS
jgi:hypothetical protein